MLRIQTHLYKENSSAGTTVPVRSLGEKGAGGKEEKPEFTVLNTKSLKVLGKVRQKEL